MFGLELFSHGEGDRGLVEGLVSSDGHFDFITDSQEEQTSLWLRKGYLSDNFVEALWEKFFSNWADTALSSLSFHKFLIEHFSQSGNIHSGSWLMTNILDKMFARFNPLSWWQDGIKDILTRWFGIHWGQLVFFGTYSIQKLVVRKDGVTPDLGQ
jgi:hypothetical protein